MAHEVEFLVVGGGPAGLGAAWQFQHQGRDWHLLEKEGHWGGLSASFQDAAGFTWDLGGHVLFSHYDFFDRMMDQALGAEGWLAHERESWIWLKRRFVPYPFQNNLHRLDPADRWACVAGLLQAAQRAGQARPRDFEDWMVATVGPGITDLFLRPYNFKVWAYPARCMDYNWIAERVAVPRLEQVLKSICTGEDEVSWGPNRLFRFPLRGGTGAIWDALGRQLPPARVDRGCALARLDLAGHMAHDTQGRAWKYRHLVTTMPLNDLAAMATGGALPAPSPAAWLYSASHVVGVGMNGQPPDHLKTKCWMYFPETHNPCYRITVFSNYSHNNVARPHAQWSLMAEVAESPHKPVDRETLPGTVIAALETDGLLPDRGAICTTVTRAIPQAYPTPFLGRDALVDPLLRALEQHDVYSRGRFGAWKYEVGNMDHSFAQGWECAARLVRRGGPECEPTLFPPAGGG